MLMINFFSLSVNWNMSKLFIILFFEGGWEGGSTLHHNSYDIQVLLKLHGHTTDNEMIL